MSDNETGSTTNAVPAPGATSAAGVPPLVVSPASAPVAGSSLIAEPPLVVPDIPAATTSEDPTPDATVASEDTAAAAAGAGSIIGTVLPSEPPLVNNEESPRSSEPAIAEAAEVSPGERESLARSKRTGVVLVIVILLLVAALAGLVYFGYTIFTESVTSDPGGIKPGTTIAPDEVEDPGAPGEIKIEETSIPNLTGLFGLTIEEVKARLGDSFQLVKTDSATEETNPAVTQLATFSYTPSVSGAEAGAVSNTSLPTESIYASLDASGKVIDIYYVCDMQLLGYPEKSFDELLAGSETVAGVLASAGVEPRDFSYTPPNPEESISYDNPNSPNRKVVKQTQIFSGRTSSDALPTVWTLTITYDFGTGVASADEFRQATRMINLKLA
ncbi:MAG: hypothetical protein LBC23_05060 [Coriobacteriales bacterium]|jgi:hypothetical protein|nr:hypothetical protein [Coriobacteriales bacterium]